MPLSGRGSCLLALACIAAVAIGYGNVVDAFFVADDHVILFGLIDPDRAVRFLPERGSSFFRPLLALSFWVDWQLWAANLPAMHVVGFALHALAAWLVGRAAATWTGSTLAGFTAALLFATSPLHPEAVTWISARGYPLGAALSLLVLGASAREQARASTLVVVGVAAAAALLSVEPALPLVAYVMALGWAQRRRASLRLGLVVAAVTAAYLAARVACLGGLGGYRGSDGGAVHASLDVGRALRTLTQAWGHLLAPGPWDGADGWGITGLVCGTGAVALVVHALARHDRGSVRLLVALVACVFAGLAVTATWATLDADLSGVRYLYFVNVFWCSGIGLAASRASAGRRHVVSALVAVMVAAQLVTLRAVNARWAESGALARAAIEGVSARVAGRDVHHVFLHGVPSSFRGAHALPWAVEQAVRVFVRFDLRVEVVPDDEQFALVRRSYLATPADQRAGVEVGTWDAEARRWRWE
ncbi:MAG: hypothetical protein R3F56_15650 [Planctomycetota bacterium]